MLFSLHATRSATLRMDNPLASNSAACSDLGDQGNEVGIWRRAALAGGGPLRPQEAKLTQLNFGACSSPKPKRSLTIIAGNSYKFLIPPEDLKHQD